MPDPSKTRARSHEPRKTTPALELHDGRARKFGELSETLELRASKLGVARLITFASAIAFIIGGVRGGSALQGGVGVVLTLIFVVLVVAHARLVERIRDAEVRRDLHRRHLDRILGTWTTHATDSGKRVPPDHPYAHDIDLVGAGSLVQRIDATQTESGITTLCRFLGSPSSILEIGRRQEAVRELSSAVDFRESLEAAALVAGGKGKLDGAPFLAFVKRSASLPKGVRIVLIASPLTLLALIALAIAGLIPHLAWAVYLIAQSALAIGTARRCHDAFDLVAARRGYVEAYRKMLATVERATFEADALRELKGRTLLGGEPPSSYLGALDRYAGLAELRTQFPIHLVANFCLLWDLHVLERLEAWNARIGQGLADVLDALGEIEALACLGGLAFIEESSTFPELTEEGTGFVAEGLAHPLLPSTERVANDVEIPGPGSAIIITGSNMAGKSTLLRSVGLDIALALAGGPVIAERLSLPVVRLRASMRIDDDLQRGASYFHAELSKLRSVVEEAESKPPIFFLLDELLRGTNAKARHVGGRAVLTHLLNRGALGMAATHDIALSALANERPGLRNLHFTDIMDGSEMMFDYRLREGVVRTSNALRLLAMAGIDLSEQNLTLDPDAST